MSTGVTVPFHECRHSLFTDLVGPVSCLLEVRANDKRVCVGVLSEVIHRYAGPDKYGNLYASLHVYKIRENMCHICNTYLQFVGLPIIRTCNIYL